MSSRDLYGVLVNQTWAAFQDGDGPWQTLAPSANTGVYGFDVTGTRFAVAFVCSDGQALNSSGDRYLLVADDTTSSQWRRATWSTYTTDNLSLSLPLPLSLSFSSLSTPYVRPVYSFPHQADAGRYSFSASYSPVRTSLYSFEIDVNPAALEGTSSHQLTFPDFSQVAGFTTKWVAPVGATLNVKGSVTVSKADSIGTLNIERGQISSLQ